MTRHPDPDPVAPAPAAARAVDPTELDRTVAALAAGDPAAVYGLVVRCGRVLAAALHRAGVGPLDPVTLDQRVQEVALLVADLAPERPGVPAAEVVAQAAAAVAGGPTCSSRPPRRPRTPSSPGRTLHLVDIENLAGGPAASTTTVGAVWRWYQVVAGRAPRDQVRMAAEKALYLRTAFELGLGIGYQPAVGRDGADRRLLEAAPLDWVVARFTRLVVGSGDHAFADLAAQARAAGVEVLAVARPGTLARRLRDAVDEVRWLPLQPGTGAAA